jgi:hypothetical protein
LARNQKKSQPDRLTSGGIIFFFLFLPTCILFWQSVSPRNSHNETF